LPTILVLPGASNNVVTVKRLKKGYWFYLGLLEKVPKEQIFFVSTVKDKDRYGVSQSEFIKGWLESRGVRAEQIKIKNLSSNTWSDVIQSIRMVCDFNLPQPLYHVSNFNHVWPRIWLIANFYGKIYRVNNKFITAGWMGPRDSVREVGALGKALGMLIKRVPMLLQ
jgi:hypothetical protein